MNRLRLSNQDEIGDRIVDDEDLRGEFNAFQTGLAQAPPGSLVLVLIDQVNEALDYLKQHTVPAKRAA